jgi:hypothetical protein
MPRNCLTFNNLRFQNGESSDRTSADAIYRSEALNSSRAQIRRRAILIARRLIFLTERKRESEGRGEEGRNAAKRRRVRLRRLCTRRGQAMPLIVYDPGLGYEGNIVRAPIRISI